MTTPAEDVKVSRDGRFLIYHDKKGGENPWRKHHTSAITRDIWTVDLASGEHRKITTFAGEDRNPVLADGDRSFYYLSEESGSFNVQRMSLQGGKPQQITSFKKLPVRFLSASEGGVLCFGYDGEVYTMRPGAQPQKVAIAIAADARNNGERILPVTGGAREMAVSPTGKEVAFIFRGEVFAVSVEGGVTKRVTNTPDQERGVTFSPDGKALLLRLRTWRQLEGVRDPAHARRRAVLLRVHRAEGNAPHRQRQGELPGALLPGREGDRVCRGPDDPEGLQRRVQGGEDAADRQGTVFQRRRRSVFPVEPRRPMDPVRLLGPGFCARRGGAGAGRRQGGRDEPHPERVQRQPRQVGPRREGDAVVQQPRRPAGGRPGRRGAVGRLRHVLHAGGLGPVPPDQGRAGAREGSRGEEGQGESRRRQEGRGREGEGGEARGDRD